MLFFFFFFFSQKWGGRSHCEPVCLTPFLMAFCSVSAGLVNKLYYSLLGERELFSAWAQSGCAAAKKTGREQQDGASASVARWASVEGAAASALWPVPGRTVLGPSI